MKNFIQTILLVVAIQVAQAQITITDNDMPAAGDTIRLSETMDIKGYDPVLTGANYNWDYSKLRPASQRVDTFFSVSSTPLAYRFYFDNIILYPNHRATFARKGLDLGSTQVPITDVYNYTKVSSSAYDNVGFGSEISGVPSSTRNIPVDREYEFPMNFNDNHISTSEYGISVPSFGFYGQEMTRTDTVDGWGSLTTPFGTFNCLRIKSILHKIDTTYIDIIGAGSTIPRPEEIEYKWMANGKGLPVLKVVTVAGNVTQIEYQDSLRLNVSIAEQLENDRMNIYPNPATNFLKVEIEESIQHVEIVSLTGKLLYESNEFTGAIKLGSFKPGLYMLRLTGNKNTYIRRFIKE